MRSDDVLNDKISLSTFKQYIAHSYRLPILKIVEAVYTSLYDIIMYKILFFYKKTKLFHENVHTLKDSDRIGL